MIQPQPIAITGLGVVSSAGAGIEAACEDLAHPVPRLTPVDRSAGYHLEGGSLVAAMTRDIPLHQWIAPMAARRMCPASKMAVAAARMAVENAGLDPADLADAAVIVATAYGASDVSERILRQVFLENPEAISPALFTESVANAPAAQIALSLSIRGPNLTITQRQAGVLLAIGRAVAMLRSGTVRRVVVAAVDELNPLLHAILDRFHTLTRSPADGQESARPFDRHRDGFLAGEGATAAILEGATQARDRGAAVQAEVIGAGSAFDPTASAVGCGHDAEAVARVFTSWLGRLDLRPSDLDLVVSSACGSPAGDHYEAHLLRSIFEQAPPPIVTPKAWLGEHGGAVLSTAVLATGGAVLGPTPGFTTRDPELDVVPHDGGLMEPPRHVLTTAPAAGGSTSWAVMSRTGG